MESRQGLGVNTSSPAPELAARERWQAAGSTSVPFYVDQIAPFHPPERSRLSMWNVGGIDGQ